MRRWQRLLLQAVFFCSGLLTLVHEVTWTRMVYPVFGMSLAAISIVVATFMGGLGIGALIFGPRADRSPAAFRLYGWIEIGIGLTAFCIPSLIGALSWVYPALSPIGTSGFVTQLVRLLSVSTLLLVPCVLIGGTFPAFVRGYVRSASETGKDLALLYALNTVGGAAGCLLGGILLPSLPMSLTIYAAATFNLAIGMALVVLAPALTPPSAEAKPEAPADTAGLGVRGSADQRDRADGSDRAILWILFLTGFLALSYEILWTRALLQIIRAAYFSFSMILAAMLVGMTLGSAIFRSVLHDKKPLLLLAGLSLTLFAASVGSFLGVFGLVDLMAILEGWLPIRDPGLNTTVARFLLCFAAFLPSAVVFGAMFPLSLLLYARFSGRFGADLGRAYGANTAGAVTGILLTGLVLIEWLGSAETLVFLLILNLGIVAIASSLLPREGLPAGLRKGSIPVLVAMAALLFAVFPRDLFFANQLAEVNRTRPGDNRVLFQAEDATSMATVFEMPDDRFRYAEDGAIKKGRHRDIIHSNSIGVGGTKVYRWNIAGAYLNTFFHPNPENILIIGYGSGRQLATLVRLPQPKHIDVVEISRVNIQASDYFYLDSSVALSDPRVQLYIDDGRNHLLRTQRLYDVIIVDVGGLNGDGREFLYTRDFLELCREHLRPDGYLFTWLQYDSFLGPVGWMYQNTFRSVFPDSHVWFGTRGKDSFAYPWIMGVRGQLNIDYPTLRRRFAALTPEQRTEIASSQIRSPADLLSLYAGSLADVPERIAEARILTDDQPPLEQVWRKNLQPFHGLIDRRFLEDPSFYEASFAHLVDERASPPLANASAQERAALGESRAALLTRARDGLEGIVKTALARGLEQQSITAPMLREFVRRNELHGGENLVAQSAVRVLASEAR